MTRYGFASPLIAPLFARPAAIASLLAVVTAFAAVPAVAQQDVSALVERVQRLERTVTDLQRSVYAGQTPPAGSLSGPVDAGAQAALPNLLTKVQLLETQIRNLTGRVEELGYKLDRANTQIEKVQADTDLRLQALEGGAPSSSAPAPSSVPAPDQTLGSAPRALGQLSQSEAAQAGSGAPSPAPQQQAALTNGSVQQQYEDAFNMLVKHDYDRAEQAFTAFVKANPQDPLAGNAQYWLGETYYVRQRYQDAAVAFLEGYQKYPKSPKAADNLLKLGMALAQVGQKAEACTSFARLQREFPDAPTNIKRRLVQETDRLKCAP
ncbi:MAG: tol-pal system protein YbgF [Thalassobaculum sp.]|uniref:tol-pal system protein YbgF n=1 Tax=Thalassobaculum sp. TaxID=2022740 RepID=UPI0032EF2565